MRRVAPAVGVVLVLVVTTPVTADPAGDRQGRPGGGADVEARRPACTIRGTRSDDRLRGTDGADVICALGGDDRVRGLGGGDVLVLGPGNDAFRAGPGDDRVLAGRGSDFGSGGAGDDRIFLRRGRDITEEWRGVDLVAGGIGDDALCVFDSRATAPPDQVRGGPGPDYVGADVGDVIRSVDLVFYGGCWD